MGGSGDAATKTAEQVAMERRQRDQLNEEIAASERRLKATARGKLLVQYQEAKRLRRRHC